MKKIKLYSIYTEEVCYLKDIFLKSIKDDWEINISNWGKCGEGGGNTFSAGWYEILRKRIEFLIDKVNENWGNIIIWSDIDIQFFARCTNHIKQAIVDQDILFLAEQWPEKEINGGFFVMRCNAKTRLFLEAVLQADIENLPFGDQTAMNNILAENKIGIKWDILPRQFWAKSHKGDPPLDIVMHHANCTIPCTKNGKEMGSIQLKLEQLKEVREYIVLQRRWKWFFDLKSLIRNLLPGQLLELIRNIKKKKI